MSINVGRAIRAAQDAYRAGDATKQAAMLGDLFGATEWPSSGRRELTRTDQAFAGAVEIARTMRSDERNALDVRQAAGAVLEALTSPTGAGARNGSSMATWRLSNSRHSVGTGDGDEHLRVRDLVSRLHTATTASFQWTEQDAMLQRVLDAAVPPGVRDMAAKFVAIGHEPDAALQLATESFAELTARTIRELVAGPSSPS